MPLCAQREQRESAHAKAYEVRRCFDARDAQIRLSYAAFMHYLFRALPPMPLLLPLMLLDAERL